MSRDKLDGLFSSRQLVEMASNVPARIAYIDDKVGTLAPGMLADFFLVRPTDASTVRNPYDALVAGNITSIVLVVIGGVPIYGDPVLLGNLKVKTEPVTVCSAARALNIDALPAGSFAGVVARLTAKMKTVGSTLAPLAECVP